jgi:hypothetical protein
MVPGRPRLDGSLEDKLDQFLADTFPCSDPLPQSLFADAELSSMDSNRHSVLGSSPALES